MTENMLTLVTVTIVNDDAETESASRCLDQSKDPTVWGTLEEKIKEAAEEAKDRFNDAEYRGLDVRTIVNITHLPKPKLIATKVEATLPQQAEDGSGSTVTTTIS